MSSTGSGPTPGARRSPRPAGGARRRGRARSGLAPSRLADAFRQRAGAALGRLRETDPGSLAEVRYVGRARVPSSHIGLWVHAAERTVRHVGPLLVTIRIMDGEG